MLQNSELILNRDGSIYHLALRPDELADTIITVGDPERVAKVSRYFDKMELKKRRREFVTHTGWLGNRRISVLSTGIGTDNIDIVFNEIDALANIDFEKREIKNTHKSLKIIRLGTSGSIQADIPIDSILVSEAAIGLDGLLHFYENDFSKNEMTAALLDHFGGAEKLPATPYFAPAGKKLLDLFSKKYRTGITVTNAGFYAPQGRKLRAQPTRPDIVDKLQSFDYQGVTLTNLEMETAGIYGLGKILGHECLSINAILANRPLGQFSKNGEKTVKKMIEAVLGFGF
jgi:uridine phosphorylase